MSIVSVFLYTGGMYGTVWFKDEKMENCLDFNLVSSEKGGEKRERLR